VIKQNLKRLKNKFMITDSNPEYLLEIKFQGEETFAKVI
jgi:hypothetical protein